MNDERTPPREAGPDAFLRAALRHAPDRDAAPPAALNAQIIEAAQRALRQAKPTPWWGRLRDGMASALAALSRPAPAAALAGLMLATVVGVMWRDGPSPDAPAVADRTASHPAPQAIDATRRDTAPAAAPEQREARAAPATAAPAKPARAQPAERPTATAPELAKAAASATSADATVRAAPAAIAQPGPAALGDQMAEQRSRVAAADEAVAMPSQHSAKQAAAAPRGAAGAMREEAAAADPLAPLAALPGRDAVDLAWLAELRRLTLGRWVLGAPGSVSAAALSGSGGSSLGRMEILDDAVAWQPAGMAGQAWRAPLPAGAAEGLRAGLAAWATPSARP